jgi:hypothetical protein
VVRWGHPGVSQDLRTKPLARGVAGNPPPDQHLMLGAPASSRPVLLGAPDPGPVRAALPPDVRGIRPGWPWKPAKADRRWFRGALCPSSAGHGGAREAKIHSGGCVPGWGARTKGGKGKQTKTWTRTMTVRGAARWLSARRLALVYQHGSCRTRASHQRDQASGRGAHHHGPAHRRLGLPLPPRLRDHCPPKSGRHPREAGGRDETGQGYPDMLRRLANAESTAAGQEIDRCSENSSLNASS